MEARKIKVFLDSNVILSGLISGQGAPRLILDLLTLGLPLLQGVTGRFNLTEIERCLARKLPSALMLLDECRPLLDLEIVPVPFLDELEPSREAVADRDLPVLASATMGHSEFFITDDKELLSLIDRQSVFLIRSLGSEEFLDRVLLDIMAGERGGRDHREGAEGSSVIAGRLKPGGAL